MSENIEKMGRRLQEWIPKGATLYGPTFFPPGSRRFVRWRIDYSDERRARVSFKGSDLADRLDALWDTIRGHKLLQGGTGDMRIQPGEIIGAPPEWPLG